MVEPVADEVNATGIYREHLVVLFNSEFQISFQVSGYFFKKGMEVCFVMVKYHQIISVPEVITDLFNFFQPMVEVSKVEIG